MVSGFPRKDGWRVKKSASTILNSPSDQDRYGTQEPPERQSIGTVYNAPWPHIMEWYEFLPPHTPHLGGTWQKTSRKQIAATRIAPVWVGLQSGSRAFRSSSVLASGAGKCNYYKSAIVMCLLLLKRLHTLIWVVFPALNASYILSRSWAYITAPRTPVSRMMSSKLSSPLALVPTT